MPQATPDSATKYLRMITVKFMAQLSSCMEDLGQEAGRQTSDDILRETVRLSKEHELLSKLESAVTNLRVRRRSEAKAKRLPPNVVSLSAWKEKRA